MKMKNNTEKYIKRFIESLQHRGFSYGIGKMIVLHQIPGIWWLDISTPCSIKADQTALAYFPYPSDLPEDGDAASEGLFKYIDRCLYAWQRIAWVAHAKKNKKIRKNS